jgi:hypothetical protein
MRPHPQTGDLRTREVEPHQLRHSFEQSRVWNAMQKQDLGRFILIATTGGIGGIPIFQVPAE